MFRCGFRISFTLVALLILGSASHCGATEFIIVQLPHSWVIGSDSLETVQRTAPRTVNKVLQVGRFIVLRYGSAGQLGDPSFDFDIALKDALKSKANQKDAFAAAKEVFEKAMSRVIAQHAINKEARRGIVLSDREFRSAEAMGFVLLSVENCKPLIDDYELFPDPSATESQHRTSGTVEKARTLYVPAVFSIPDVLRQIDPTIVRANPEEAVRALLSEALKNPFIPAEGIGPPYVVEDFDGETLRVMGETTDHPSF